MREEGGGETSFSIAPPGTCETVLFSRGSRDFPRRPSAPYREVAEEHCLRSCVRLASARAAHLRRKIVPSDRRADRRPIVDTRERECPQTGLDLEYFLSLSPSLSPLSLFAVPPVLAVISRGEFSERRPRARPPPTTYGKGNFSLGSTASIAIASGSN